MDLNVQELNSQRYPEYGSCEADLEIPLDTPTIALVPRPLERHWGNYKVFLFLRGEPLIAIGPHWYVFLGGFSAFWFITGLLLDYQKSKQGTTQTQYAISLCLCLSQLLSYLLVAIKNPGLANRDIVETNEDIKSLPDKPRGAKIWLCKKCLIVQPGHTVHCDFCNICIYGHDHHCPWTGKCIGKHNFAEFVVFIILTFVMLTNFLIQSVSS